MGGVTHFRLSLLHPGVSRRYGRFHVSMYQMSFNNISLWFFLKTSQELRMLSSVTLNCQVTKIVMNSGSQLSQL